MLKLKIDKMHCMGCALKIENVLKEIDTSIEVSAEIEHQTLLIKTQATSSEIKSLIENAGYPVKKTEEV